MIESIFSFVTMKSKPLPSLSSDIPSLCMVAFFLLMQPSAGFSQTIKIGDAAPTLEATTWIKGEIFTGFKQGTAYVVEMGATWCKPCIAAIPELTQLSEKYAGEVEVIGLFVKEMDMHKPDYLDRLQAFVKKQGDKMQYRVGADDPGKTIERSWIKAFGASRGVPQTFVVDKEGKIAAHFGGGNVRALEDLLDAIVEGTYRLNDQIANEALRNKVFTPFDYKKPLLVDGNGGHGSDFLFRSILSKSDGTIRSVHIPWLSKTGWLYKERTRRFIEGYLNMDWEAFVKKELSESSTYQTVNATIAQLYQVAYADTLYYTNVNNSMWTPTDDYVDPVVYPRFKTAYGKQWIRPVMEVKDSASLYEIYNYSVKVPDKKASAGFIQRCLREDLKRYFDYAVTVETRPMPCWFLKARPGAVEKLSTLTPGAKRLSRKVTDDSGVVYVRANDRIVDLIRFLNKSKSSVKYPVIDKTGIPNGEIDYQLTGDKYESMRDSRNFEIVKNLLEEEFGLYLEKGRCPMQVVVIRDPASRQQLAAPQTSNENQENNKVINDAKTYN